MKTASKFLYFLLQSLSHFDSVDFRYHLLLCMLTLSSLFLHDNLSLSLALFYKNKSSVFCLFCLFCLSSLSSFHHAYFSFPYLALTFFLSLSILFWLGKDCAWNGLIPSMWIIFVVPTILIALDFVHTSLYADVRSLLHLQFIYFHVFSPSFQFFSVVDLKFFLSNILFRSTFYYETTFIFLADTLFFLQINVFRFLFNTI